MNRKTLWFFEKNGCMDLVVQLLEKMPEAERLDDLRRVFVKCVKLGRTDLARELTLLFPEQIRLEKYNLLVKYYVESGWFREAEQIAKDHLKRNLCQDEILQIANHYYEIDFDGTHLETAAEMANKFPGGKCYEWLSKILKKQVTNGYFRGADKTALYLRRVLTDEELQEMYAVCKRRHSVGFMKEIGRRLKKDYGRDLDRMLARCYKKGMLKQAHDIADTMPEFLRINELLRIFDRYLTCSRLDQAAYVASTMNDPEKSECLNKILKQLVCDGNLYECEKIASQYFSRKLNHEELKKILAVCIQKRRVGDAESAALQILVLEQS